MKKIEFCSYELTETAYAVYSNSDFTFYKDDYGKFYVADNPCSSPVELGTLNDVIDFLCEE